MVPNGFSPLSVFAERLILDVWQGSECALNHVFKFEQVFALVFLFFFLVHFLNLSVIFSNELVLQCLQSLMGLKLDSYLFLSRLNSMNNRNHCSVLRVSWGFELDSYLCLSQLNNIWTVNIMPS